MVNRSAEELTNQKCHLCCKVNALKKFSGNKNFICCANQNSFRLVMERVQKRKNEETGGGEAKKRKKEKDFIRGKLGGPYEQYCMLFLKHRAQEEDDYFLHLK